MKQQAFRMSAVLLLLRNWWRLTLSTASGTPRSQSQGLGVSGKRDPEYCWRILSWMYEALGMSGQYLGEWPGFFTSGAAQPNSNMAAAQHGLVSRFVAHDAQQSKYMRFWAALWPMGIPGLWQIPGQAISALPQRTSVRLDANGSRSLVSAVLPRTGSPARSSGSGERGIRWASSDSWS